MHPFWNYFYYDMEKPTQRQIDDAEEYLRSRIEVTDKVERELHTVIDDAARKIASIVLRYHSSGRRLRFIGSSRMAREIDEVIQWLEDEIFMLVDDNIVPEDESDKDEVSAIALGMDHGATYEERSSLYHNKVERSLDDAEWLAFLSEFDDSAQDIEELVEFIKESSDKSLHRWLLLAVNTVAVGWGIHAMLQARKEGREGFFIINMRGACEYCRDMEGWHPIGDPMPPLHPYCRCLAVYV